MTTKRLFNIPQPIVILMLGGLLVLAVGTLKPAPKPVPAEVPAPVAVSVVLANPQTQSLTVRSQGTVMPRREIDLVAQVAGSVQEVVQGFVDGGFFAKNSPLLEIDNRDYQFSLIRSEARVAEAAQALATERGRVRQAKREWRDLGNPEANDLFLRKPQLAAAEANLASAEADRDQAKLDLERTRISVPFAGRVRETYVDLGQYVSLGTRIASVYDSSVAVIRLPLTDRQVALVDLPLGVKADRNGSAPKVMIAGVIAGQRYQWQGRIIRTDASVDTRSRLYYAVAEVADPFVVDPSSAQFPLVVGLFVEAEISGRQIDNVITLPKAALFKRNHVYTLDAGNRIQTKQVSLLQSDGKTAWVKGDIAPGEQIVLGKQGLLSEGVVVLPQPANELVAGG